MPNVCFVYLMPPPNQPKGNVLKKFAKRQEAKEPKLQKETMCQKKKGFESFARSVEKRFFRWGVEGGVVSIRRNCALPWLQGTCEPCLRYSSDVVFCPTCLVLPESKWEGTGDRRRKNAERRGVDVCACLSVNNKRTHPIVCIKKVANRSFVH